MTVNIDKEVETGEQLTDESFLKLVSETRTADSVSNDDDDDELIEPVIKRCDARKGLAQTVSFCEQNPALSSHLDNLWTVIHAIETYSGSSVQKTMLDFVNSK